MTDKKIEEYLDRAKVLLNNALPHGDNYGEFIIGTVEIAKMIQLEEHRESNKDADAVYMELLLEIEKLKNEMEGLEEVLSESNK